jgi:hypothetical protein
LNASPYTKFITATHVKQGGQMMKTVTLDVRSPEQAAQDFVNAWKSGKAQKSARISFATPELLWKVLTAKRWEILKAMPD